MRKFGFRHYAALVLLAGQLGFAQASDELVIYVFDNSQAGGELSVSLDQGTPVLVGNDGSVTLDLDEGAHALSFSRDGELVKTVRFDSAGGQYVDINFALPASGDAKVSIDSYFATESAVERRNAPKGSVAGVLKFNGLPLSGATVQVAGSNISATTGDDGRYTLELPRGNYELQISQDFERVNESRDIRIVGRVTRQENFNFGDLGGSDTAVTGAAGDDFGAEFGGDVEDVLVTAQLDPSAFEESERYSVNVLDTLGAEELARFGGTDVAASVVRVPSVTVQGGKYVFIRGLGGRYITTTLNSATLPSTDPSKRTVPLDLFPSNIVNQLDIRKTFVSYMPGESTGGNLVINTRSFPEQRSGKVDVSLGYVSGLTGETVAADPSRSDMDLLGWDSGKRKLPGGVNAIAQTLQYSDEYSQNTEFELRRVGGLLMNQDLDLDTATATPKVSLGVNYGDVFELGSNDLGFFAAANYRNGWSQRDSGISRSYTPAGDISDNFSFQEATNDIDISGLLSIGLNSGNSTYQANTLLSRATENSVRVSEGLDGDAGLESYRYAIDWIERQFISQQFTGEHVLGVAEEWIANWQFTASQADRYAPDRREVRFDLREGDGVYNLEVPNLLRRYDDLADNNFDGSFDFEYNFPTSETGTVSNVNFGAQIIYRERDSESETYGYFGGRDTDDNAANRLVSEVLHAGNISGDPNAGFAFVDKTVASDSYDAELELTSVFVNYDVNFSDTYQFIIGGRFENYVQTTETFQIDGEGDKVESKIDEGTFLPGLSFNWYYADDQQLRMALSKTVSRPDFKETSNAVFFDKEFDFRIRGNPNLVLSEVVNVDVRWETYWSDSESLNIAAFYKDLKDPIERVVQPASGTAGNSRTFQNAESGTLFGVETDFIKNFDIGDSYSTSLFVAFNGSYIDSEVTLQGGDTRKLQGQPDYTLNLVFGVDDLNTGQQFTLLFNQNGESIIDVGISGLPDVIEEPRLQMDLNYKFEWTPDVAFKLKVGNVLNSEVEFTQGGQVFQRYEKGIEFGAGFDWKF